MSEEKKKYEEKNEDEHEKVVVEKKKERETLIDKIRGNPWVVSTFVLLILGLILIFGSFSGERNSITGNVIEESEAKGIVLGAFFALTGEQIEVNDVSVHSSGFYEVFVNVEGESLPVYLSLDGKYLISGLYPINELKENFANEEKIVNVGVDNDPVLGSVDAPVTIVAFSDYQCPFCRKFWTDSFFKIKENYIDTGKVKFVFRDFPLESLHPMAQSASEAAECVRAKGGDLAYYKYHDKLFEEQNILDGGDAKLGPVMSTVSFTINDLKEWASEIGYDIDLCLDSGEMGDEVKNDLSDGISIGISGTPAFIINGRLISGAQPFSVFEEIIEEELVK